MEIESTNLFHAYCDCCPYKELNVSSGMGSDGKYHRISTCLNYDICKRVEDFTALHVK